MYAAILLLKSFTKLPGLSVFQSYFVWQALFISVGSWLTKWLAWGEATAVIDYS